MEVQNIANVVAKMSKEHKIVTDYIVRFKKSLNRQDKEFFKEFNNFINFLQKDLLRHFEIEELFFFPAAARGDASYDTTHLVLGLQKDHGFIEGQLQLLMEEIKLADSWDEMMKGKLMEKMDRFFTVLANHCRQEFTELYPLIDGNNNCRALLKEYIEQTRQSSR